MKPSGTLINIARGKVVDQVRSVLLLSLSLSGLQSPPISGCKLYFHTLEASFVVTTNE